MAVCAFDRAQVAQSYVRKRRVPAEVRTMYCERCARGAAGCARYDADPCAHGKRREVRTVCCGNAHDKLRTSFQFPIWPDMLTVRLPI